MTLATLKNANRVIGIKQVTKAVKRGNAAMVFIATDAEKRVTDPVKELCENMSVPVQEGFMMKELGEACAIEVGAAAVAVLK